MSTRSLLIFSVAAALASAVPAEARQGGRGGQQVALPEGEGKEVVQAVCTACHGLNNIVGSTGYDEAGWRHVISAMVALPEPQAATVVSYLAENFPAKTARRPTAVSGQATVQISEWFVPTLGQRSRDPVQAADGAVWWTGQFASLIGRIDPVTGAMREYKLAPDARPHSIVEDPDGRHMWFTGNGNGTIGKVEPTTGEITVVKTESRDPHTAIFNSDGIMFFTAQGARMIGRYNPKTGELKEVPTEPNPYGIKIDTKGFVWVAHNGTNKLSRVDPNTMEIEFFDLPDPASRIRRLDLTSDDMVWFVNSALGRIGRLNPETGEIKEWPTPSGPTSHPYAIAVVDDIIWFNESGMRPDQLVRFDPKTEKFQTFPIPSGVGIIRNMFVTREGNLLIHQSSMNRIGLVQIGRPVSSR